MAKLLIKSILLLCSISLIPGAMAVTTTLPAQYHLTPLKSTTENHSLYAEAIQKLEQRRSFYPDD